MADRDKKALRPGSARPACANKILSGLPDVSRRPLISLMERISLRSRQILHPHDKPLKFVFFPCDALVSVLMRSNGKTVEVAMVGNEGFFGLPVLFGTEKCPMAALVQVAGEAYRMPVRDFKRVLQADPYLKTELGKYAQAYSVMLGQTAVCFSAHMVEQRCAKWLLMAHDRLQADEFPMTQEFLAQMLGVRRSTVNEIADRMRSEGLIRYRQGRITIADRAGLEALTCSCYGVIRNEFEQSPVLV